MGLFSSIGKLFNDVTGTTHSAKLNNQYQKEFAKNAHQWEVEDLKKAGLNPAISGGGSGASASGGGNAGTSGVNPISMLTEGYTALKGMKNQTDLTDAQIQNTNADTINKTLNNKYVDEKTKKEMAETDARTSLLKMQKEESASKKELNKSETEQNKKGLGAKIMGNEASEAVWNAAKKIGEVVGL